MAKRNEPTRPIAEPVGVPGEPGITEGPEATVAAEDVKLIDESERAQAEALAEVPPADNAGSEPLAIESAARAAVRRRQDRRMQRARTSRLARPMATSAAVQQAAICPQGAHVINPHTGSCLNCGIRVVEQTAVV